MNPTSKGKPIWVSIAIFLIGFGVYALKQKGYLGGNTPQQSTQTTQPPAQTKQAPTQPRTTEPETPQPTQPAPRQTSEPAPKQTSTTTPTPKQSTPISSKPKAQSDGGIAELFRKQQSDTWVEASGTVKKILPDDSDGDKHQRFIVRLSTDIEILIAHNIDVGARVPVNEGDSVTFRGEYEYTDKGGTVHFTHAPKYERKQPGGWIEHKGKKYE